MFVRGSNNLKSALAIRRGRIHPDEYEQPILRAGDAFLFENRTYHAPASNYTDRVAKVVIYGYHYRWIKPGPLHAVLQRGNAARCRPARSYR